MHAKLLLRSSKKRSMEALAKNHLWFLVFLSAFLLVFSLLGISYFSFAALRALLSPIHASVWASVSVLLFWIFLLSPLWRGVQMLFLHELLFGRSEMALVLYCYSHRRRYFFAVRRAVRSICLWGGCFGLLVWLSVLGQRVAVHLLEAERPAASLLILILTVFFLCVILFFCFSLSGDTFLVDAVFLSSPLLSYSQTRAIAVRRMRSERALLCRLRCSFIPLWTLSVVLLGLPLILVLPYYIALKAHLAAALIKD